MDRVPVAEGIFTWPADDSQLIGSRCTACGIGTFPSQGACPRCAATAMAKHLLPRRGLLSGLIANGEPIGASGLRQGHEVVLQLRGQAGDRQSQFFILVERGIWTSRCRFSAGVSRSFGSSFRFGLR
jgi:hypothetical protein